MRNATTDRSFTVTEINAAGSVEDFTACNYELAAGETLEQGLARVAATWDGPAGLVLRAETAGDYEELEIAAK